MNTHSSHLPIENRLLAALPEKAQAQLLPHLQSFPLVLSTVLYDIDDPIQYVYFPNSGMISLLSHTAEGETLELGIIGKEGMAGIAVFLGEKRAQHRHLVQGQGEALRMKADLFKAKCEELPSLIPVLHKYVHALLTKLNQLVLCNRFHSSEERLCRWLLQCQDCMQADELHLTQEFLAFMLGVHRPAVTLAARLLQSAGLIRYSRGNLKILDQEGLEAVSCECYKVVRNAINWHQQLLSE